MNWAAWEYRIACCKRKVAWNAAAKKVEGSRVMLFDSRPKSPYFRSSKMMGCEYSYLYGGAVSGRMGSGKTTATQIMMQQQAMRRLLRPVQQQMNQYFSHAIDAMAYGAMLHTKIEKKLNGKWRMVNDEIWLDEFEWDVKPKGKIKHRYYERTSRWVMAQQDKQGRLALETLIASAPSLNDTSLSVLARSGREPSWRMPGGRSRTRRKSME